MVIEHTQRSALETTGLIKEYGGNRVLDQVSLKIGVGEIRALMGANGAGKSTLVKMLGGIVTPTGGRMLLEGEAHEPSSPSDAQRAGIAIVHQELSLVPGLTVAENITMGRWPTRRRGPVSIISSDELRKRARESLELLGETTSPDVLVGRLPPAQRQLIEIAKALAWNPKILILDEPTSSLATHEVDNLLSRIRRLGQGGVSVIYVSHRMDEIPRVADTVTVLRNGREVQTNPVSEMDTPTIARLMIGEEVASRQDSASVDFGDIALSVQGLTRKGSIDDISFEVRKGEIVGLVGLMGSGRTEILRAIFGLDPASGDVSIHGDLVERRSPQRMIEAGVALTPEDRKGQGLVLGLFVAENLVMTCYDRVRSRLRIISDRRQRTMALASIEQLSIAGASPSLAVGRLSGGNQQKVVLGKWINRGADVLLFDEPTRGVDVHAKAETYEIIRDLARHGAAAVFVSSEADEVFLVCDRILVVRNGRIVAERRAHETSSAEILELCMKEENPS